MHHRSLQCLGQCGIYRVGSKFFINPTTGMHASGDNDVCRDINAIIAFLPINASRTLEAVPPPWATPSSVYRFIGPKREPRQQKWAVRHLHRTPPRGGLFMPCEVHNFDQRPQTHKPYKAGRANTAVDLLDQ